MKYKRFIPLTMAMLMILSFAGTSQAALSAAGPTDPGNGFPTWYQDAGGLALAPCMTKDPAVADQAFSRFCVMLNDCLPGQTPPACFNPSLPIVFPSNWPIEFFYWVADARQKTNAGPLGTAKIVFRMALEGGFLSYPIVPGQQQTFLRVNLKGTGGLVPNSTYNFTYPFGSFSVTTDSGGNTIRGLAGQAFRVQDGCLAAPCDFTLLLPAPGTGIGPFLKSPAGFFTDPAVPGVNFLSNFQIPTTLTPGPNGAVLTITGPSIGGVGPGGVPINTLTLTDWTLAGKVFNGVLPTPLLIDRTTYGCSAGAPPPGQVDVFASSGATTTLTVSGGPKLPALPQPMAGDPAGNFYTDILLPDASVLPPTVLVTATTPSTSPTSLSSNLVDVVKITAANYDLITGTLTVSAVSSDQCSANGLAPVLTLAGFGPLIAGTLATPVAVPPPAVLVQSSKGGFDMADVNITSSVAPTLSISGTVNNDAVPPAPIAGVSITLSGAANRATITAPNGTYSFSNLLPGGYSVTPSAALYTFAPLSTPVTLTLASASGVNFTGTLLSTYSISGSVKTAALAPIAGVSMILTQGAATIATATTDILGNYSFATVPAGTYALTPSLAGVAFTPISTAVAGPPAIVANFTGTFAPFTISGSVLSATDLSGIPGVTVTLTGTNALGAPVIATATTAASGAYTLTNLINGTYTVTPTKAGLVFTPPSSPANVAGANVLGVNFTAPTFSISGTIRSPLGTGLPGITVNLTGNATATTTTDAVGNYIFTGLSNGAYTVTPVQAGLIFTPLSLPVTIAGANVINQNFTGASFSISGTIRSIFGVGLAGITVNLSGNATATTTTDALGNYIFTGLGNGAYTVTPVKAGMGFTPSSIAVTIAGVNVTNQNFTGASFAISGKVTNSVGGTPAAGVTITLTGGGITRTATTDGLGNYIFTGLGAAVYTVTPSQAGHSFSPVFLSVTVTSSDQKGQNFKMF